MMGQNLVPHKILFGLIDGEEFGWRQDGES